MSRYLLSQLIAVSLVSTLVSLSGFAATSAPSGPGLSGGGNWQEADFAMSARTLYRILNADRIRSQKAIGVDLAQLDEAIRTTQVVCATEPMLSKMRSLKKKAYFESSLDSIALDCEHYQEISLAGQAKYVVILHEYMRKIAAEGSEYRNSANLSQVIVNIIVNVTIQPVIVVEPSMDYNFDQCIKMTSNSYYENDKTKLKWGCLNKFAQTITFDQCLKVANSNYYEADKVKMKNVCLNLTANLQQCIKVASSNYYEDDKTTMSQSCLIRFRGTYNIDQCIAVANSNYYEDTKTRFKEFCMGFGGF